LGIIYLKAQSEALLAKLLVRGLASSGKPWKEMVGHKADQVRLPVHGKGPNTPDINWLFVAPKLKRIQCSMWKNIVGAWMNVRSGLAKSDPTNATETLRQPLFGNSSIRNSNGTLLGISGLREGNTFTKAGCSRIQDLWNPRNLDWKNLAKLGMSYHPPQTNNARKLSQLAYLGAQTSASISRKQETGSAIQLPFQATRSTRCIKSSNSPQARPL
jgi:hypothetical protein